ncbi:MAG: hypothetical protein HC836_48990 [Richelia sp. RM2_1_2]|nr:hypothetical protein [Richelia sp. RM2_1_2]
MKSGITTNQMLDLIRSNESDEFLSYFPEFKEPYNKLKDKYKTFLATIDRVWEHVKDIKNKKEFALKVKDYPFSGILFEMYKDILQNP